MKLFCHVILFGSLCCSSLCAAWDKKDVRFPQLLNPEKVASVHLENGLLAWRDSNSIIVEIPGSYLDTLTGFRDFTLTKQMAAASVLLTCKVDAKTPREVYDRLYRGSKEVKQGSGETFQEHKFEISKGNFVNVFVYLNELTGITAVLNKSNGAPR